MLLLKRWKTPNESTSTSFLAARVNCILIPSMTAIVLSERTETMIIEWISNNYQIVARLVIATPMVLAVIFATFLMFDDISSNYSGWKWYAKLVAGRDANFIEDLIIRTFLTLGLASIVIPCIAIYVYMYYTGDTLVDLWHQALESMRR